MRTYVVCCILSVLLLNCSSNSDIHGIVYDAHGDPAPFTFVHLQVIDDRGDVLADLGNAVSDAQGHYNIANSQQRAPNMVVEALFGDQALRGFAFGDGKTVPVSPLTEALVTAILNITTPAAGASLNDFAWQQLIALTEDAIAIDTADLDLSDSQEVFTTLLDQLGRAIAAASGAEFAASPSSSIGPTNDLDTGLAFSPASGSCLSSLFYVIESDNFSFDFTPEGEICDGFGTLVNDTFDEAFHAQLGNEIYVGSGDTNFPALADMTVQDQQTAVFGPEATTNDIDHTRKIYISAAGDTARYVETLTNNDTTSHTVELQITGNLGADDASSVLVRGLDDDLTLDATDRFAAVVSALVSNVPSIGFVWQDNNGIDIDTVLFGAGAADLFQWVWEGITLAPGETKSIVYYTFIDPSRDAEVLRAKALAIAENPDMAEMTGDELASLQNFAANLGNISGTAGAVTQGAEITIKNQRTNATVTTQAKSDWSFFAYISALSGDELTITATDGLETSVSVP